MAVKPFPESGPRPYDPDANLEFAAVPETPGRARAERRLMALPGVEGVGEGRDPTGAPAWIAYLSHRGAARALPRTIAGRPVVVEISGPIEAQRG